MPLLSQVYLARMKLRLISYVRIDVIMRKVNIYTKRLNFGRNLTQEACHYAQGLLKRLGHHSSKYILCKGLFNKTLQTKNDISRDVVFCPVTYTHIFSVALFTYLTEGTCY